MISLTFTVDSIHNVMVVFDRIQIMMYTGTGVPDSPVTSLVEYTTISGTDEINNRDGVSDVLLDADYSQYYFTHPIGEAEDWYISRYYNESTGANSGWADPILGEPGDIYYDPLYPVEIEYGSEDQQIIDRIRTYMGDPIGLNREYGEDAASSIHPDGRTYELDEKGWPASVNMNGNQYVSTSNPSINGYRYLRFAEFIDVTTPWSQVVSGTCDVRTGTYGVDIWYYTFRNSDRQIMEAYDRCPIPPSLTSANVTVEAYVLQTAINLLYQENWEDAIEDGAVITDEATRYDPSAGLRFRNELLDKLNAKLDKLVKGLVLRGISGVRID
jgi:hypothetical protein